MDWLCAYDALDAQAMLDAPKHLIQKWGWMNSVNDNKTLSYAPQYAVMDIPTDDKESTAPGNDLQHDIANPLIIND